MDQARFLLCSKIWLRLYSESHTGQFVFTLKMPRCQTALTTTQSSYRD